LEGENVKSSTIVTYEIRISLEDGEFFFVRPNRFSRIAKVRMVEVRQSGFVLLVDRNWRNDTGLYGIGQAGPIYHSVDEVAAMPYAVAEKVNQCLHEVKALQHSAKTRAA
jgi:hypothetical protein